MAYRFANLEGLVKEAARLAKLGSKIAKDCSQRAKSSTAFSKKEKETEETTEVPHHTTMCHSNLSSCLVTSSGVLTSWEWILLASLH